MGRARTPRAAMSVYSQGWNGSGCHHYEINESEAISDAWEEGSRRLRTSVEQRTQGQMERTLDTPQCPERAEHTLREQGMEKGWDFAKFVGPSAAESYDMQNYEMRAEGLLDCGRITVVTMIHWVADSNHNISTGLSNRSRWKPTWRLRRTVTSRMTMSKMTAMPR